MTVGDLLEDLYRLRAASGDPLAGADTARSVISEWQETDRLLYVDAMLAAAAPARIGWKVIGLILTMTAPYQDRYVARDGFRQRCEESLNGRYGLSAESFYVKVG